MSAKSKLPWHSLIVIRQRTGLTQRELAERVGTSTSYIGQLEMGFKWPGYLITQKLAAALDIPVEAIVRVRVLIA